MKLIVSRAAAADLQRLRAFLFEKDPPAAQRAVSGIVRAIDSLDLFPDRGRPSEVSGVRELVVPFGRSAYIVRSRMTRNARRLSSFAYGMAVKIVRDWESR